MSQTSTCFKTVVKNISGGELTVSCWPPHGKTFAADEEVTIDGSLHDFFNRYRVPPRVLPTLHALFTDGNLSVISEPNPILYDATDDRTAMLVLDNGVLKANDPCFAETEFSSEL